MRRISACLFIKFGTHVQKVIRELSGLILTRGPKLCNFVEWRGYKVVYRRYASAVLLSSTIYFIDYAAFEISACLLLMSLYNYVYGG